MMAVDALAGVGPVIIARDIPLLIKEISDTLESLCTVSKVRAFERPEAFEALATIIDAAFETGEEEAVRCASSVLATVVPQLADSPTATRKLLARCVLAFQLFTDSACLMRVLSASRALFEHAVSERQILISSLPTAYIRLFRSGELLIQGAAADALVRVAGRISQPIIVVRCFLQIISTQGIKVSSTVVNGIRRVIATMKLADGESTQCVSALLPLLQHPKAQMREVVSQTISIVILASSPQRVAEAMGERLLFNQKVADNALIILNDLLKATGKAPIQIILPIARELLPAFRDSDDPLVQKGYPTILTTMMIADVGNLPELFRELQVVCEGGTIQQQVVACQEFHRLEAIPEAAWAKEKGLTLRCLVNAYLQGEPAVKSAAAASMFDLFKLDELEHVQLSRLADTTQHKATAYAAFHDIIKEVQSDRANQRTAK
jgi:hypothetical protein